MRRVVLTVMLAMLVTFGQQARATYYTPVSVDVSNTVIATAYVNNVTIGQAYFGVYGVTFHPDDGGPDLFNEGVLCISPTTAGLSGKYFLHGLDDLLNPTKLDQVAAIFEHSFPPNTPQMSGAISAAVTEVLNDSNPSDVTSGNARFEGLSQSTVNLANYLVQHALTDWLPSTNPSGLLVFEHLAGYPGQDLITFKVPEPATFVLLGGFALLLGLYREMQNKPWLRMCFERQRRK